MSDPRFARVERRNHSSPFWGIMLLFVVVVAGLIAYAYYGVQTMQAPTPPAASSVNHATGQGGDAPVRPADQP
jgi:hypothetical protein